MSPQRNLTFHKHPKPTPTEVAQALIHVATGDGDESPLEVAKRRIQRFDRLAKAVPDRALVASLSPKLDRKRPALRWAMQWAKQHRRGLLVLAGQPGVGKTVAAAWYAARTGAYWLPAGRLGMAHYAEADKLGATARAAGALVLDEVGGQGATSDTAVARISTLISDRFADRKPTVITTNLDQQAFAQVYDGVDELDLSRIIDRIREDGKWLDVTHESLRGSALDLDTSVVDNARDLVRLVAAAETLEPDARVLEALQRVLGVKDEQIVRFVEACRESRARIDAMLADIVGKTRPKRDDRNDDERQADVRKQVDELAKRRGTR